MKIVIGLHDQLTTDTEIGVLRQEIGAGDKGNALNDRFAVRVGDVEDVAPVH